MSDLSPDDSDRLAEALQDALASAFSTVERAMLTRWVVLAETIDEEGERGLWTLTDTAAKAWDTVGLLQHALHIQHTQTLNRADGDDPD